MEDAVKLLPLWGSCPRSGLRGTLTPSMRFNPLRQSSLRDACHLPQVALRAWGRNLRELIP